MRRFLICLVVRVFVSFFECFSVLAPSSSFKIRCLAKSVFSIVSSAWGPNQFCFINHFFLTFSIQLPFFAEGLGPTFVQIELAHPCLTRHLSFFFIVRRSVLAVIPSCSLYKEWERKGLIKGCWLPQWPRVWFIPFNSVRYGGRWFISSHDGYWSMLSLLL